MAMIALSVISIRIQLTIFHLILTLVVVKMAVEALLDPKKVSFLAKNIMRHQDMVRTRALEAVGVQRTLMATF